MIHPTEKPTWKGRLIALAVGGLLALFAAELMLRIANPNWREFFSGWFMEYTFVEGMGAVRVGKPGFEGYFAQNNGDFRTRIAINDDGLRNLEPADRAGEQAWVVGDSMAFGWGVEASEAYSERLQEFSSVPVYSVASPGTNVCGYQRLVARMPDAVRPRAVIVGLILENDVAVYDCKTEATTPVGPVSSLEFSFFNLSDVKQKLTKHSAVYNFFAVSLKRIDLANELLIRIGLVKRAHTMRMAVPDDEIIPRVESTVTELMSLRSQFDSDVPFVVVVAPTRFEMRDQLESRRQLRLEMHERLNEAGIETIDPFDAFMSLGYDKIHFVHDGHWRPAGHDIVARALADWFQRRSIEP